MKLYGSITSPYARRLRILMANVQYDFVNIDVFGEDRELLKEKNPTLKIPMLEDFDNPACPIIFDSAVIHQYLTTKFHLPNLTVIQQTQMSILDSCTDSLINMFLLARSGVDVSQDNLYFNTQRERISVSFDCLEKLVLNKNIHDWNYVAISLYCLIEWAQFRKLFDFANYPNLTAFIELNHTQVEVEQTKPTV